jgi:hypothetical protein
VPYEEVVARQHGVLSLAQAVAHGYSADRVQRRVREGRWRRLYPGVVLVGGHRLTDDARTVAAWLWAGERAAVAGPDAARWHEMPVCAPAVVDVTLPRALHRRARPGLRLRRRDLADEDVAVVRGLRLTGRALTVLETAVALAEGSAFLDRALQRHVRFEEVYRAYCRSVGGWELGHPFGPYLIDLAFPEAKVAVEIDGWAWHLTKRPGYVVAEIRAALA